MSITGIVNQACMWRNICVPGCSKLFQEDWLLDILLKGTVQLACACGGLQRASQPALCVFVAPSQPQFISEAQLQSSQLVKQSGVSRNVQAFHLCVFKASSKFVSSRPSASVSTYDSWCNKRRSASPDRTCTTSRPLASHTCRTGAVAGNPSSLMTAHTARSDYMLCLL